MLYALWSAKGGAGVTTTAVGLASSLATSGRTQVLLVDLSGDLPAATGLAEPEVGLTDWLAGSAAPEALTRLELGVAAGVDLLPLGGARSWPEPRSATAVELLASDDRTLVIDLGVLRPALDHGPAARLRDALLLRADRSYLVTRACYLALRRAVALDRDPDGIVLVREPGRALDRADVESLLPAPVVAEVDLDPVIARMVDAGLLVRRVPRHLERALRRVA